MGTLRPQNLLYGHGALGLNLRSEAGGVTDFRPALTFCIPIDTK